MHRAGGIFERLEDSLKGRTNTRRFYQDASLAPGSMMVGVATDVSHSAGQSFRLHAGKNLTAVSGTGLDLATGGDLTCNADGNMEQTAARGMRLEGRGSVLVASDGRIRIGNASGFIEIAANGTITIKGPRVDIN